MPPAVRHYLKDLIIAASAFYTAYSLVPTINLGNDPKNVVIVVASLWLISLVVQPIFGLILLPINIFTFGLLAAILNLGLIFSLSKFLPGFSIGPYHFPGANITGFIIPPVNLNQLEAMLAVALIITLVQKVLHFVFE